MSKRIKRVVSAVLLTAGVVLALIFGYRGLHYLEQRSDPGYSVSDVSNLYDDEVDRPSVAIGGKWYAPREGLETVLLIGLDKFQEDIDPAAEFRNDQQSDFLVLLVFDQNEKTCAALQVNRDTMAQIHSLGLNGEDVGVFTGQLALSHTYGTGGLDSGRNTLRAVSEFLYGTEIGSFVSVTMDAVAILTDKVGGVPVEVKDDFSGIDPTLRKGETVTLRGEQALTYVRARRGLEDSSNLARMERQRQYLFGLYQRLKEYAVDPGTRASLVMELGPYVVSDCSAQQLYDLADRLSSYELTDILTMEGEARLGEKFMEFYPDEAALTRQLLQLLYEPVDE